MTGPFSFFGGIDFSGAKEPLANLWTAIGREEGGKLEIVSLRPHAYRADLAAFASDGWRVVTGAEQTDRVLWGVDFPFGFAAAAARHLLGDATGWEPLLSWVADRPPDEVRNAVPEELRGGRLTDTGGAVSPFDLRMYRQAVEGIRWLHGLRESATVSVHPLAVDATAASSLIEVHPSSTAHELGLPRRRSPGRPGEIRARAAALRTFLTFVDPEHEAIAVTLEDAWDAMVSCLTAFLARGDLDQPFRATTHPRAVIELEGWIYRAPDTLR